MLANVGTEEGVFEADENKIIQSIIKRKAIRVHEVMTHRTDIVALSVNASLDEVVSVVSKEKYSRLPIYEDSIDNIVGILHAKDLIKYLSGPHTVDEFNVRDFSRTAYIAPMYKTMDQLFKDFQQNKIHIAIIIDEFGGTAGIVTLEDLLEEIVGEIFDEDDEIVRDIIKVDDNTFYVNGGISLDDVVDYFKVDLPIEQYETLNGFMIGQLGRIPKLGDRDSIEYAGLVFKIEEVDGRMISKVKVCKVLKH